MSRRKHRSGNPVESVDCVVRQATKEDVPDIMHLLKVGIKDEHGVDEIPGWKTAAIQREYGFYYLGFVEGKAVGMRGLLRQQISWISSGGLNILNNAAYLKDGVTLREYRGRGVSTAIDEKIFAEAKKQGITKLYDSTETHFMLEKRLKQGFTVCGTCVTCPKGPGCRGSMVKLELKK